MHSPKEMGTSGGGMTPVVSDRDGLPSTDPMLPQKYAPELQPAIRGIAENAGFPRETLEGAALLSENTAGIAKLRLNSEDQAHGTNPGYPGDLMNEFGHGEDLRHFGGGDPAQAKYPG
jgi:hypothetical protein